MYYIVFDLEWNQGTQENKDPKLPFEIVEIGAVKLNERFEKVDTFQILVNPVVYQELNHEIHKIVPLEMDELRVYGVSFKEAAERFFSWCGSGKYRFCTWGDMDLTELQMNMEYFHVGIPFKTPVFYYNIQKNFGVQYLDGRRQCALEDAVERLGIPAESGFHRALRDAEYTASVMKFLNKEAVLQNYSVDCYKNPQKKEEELHLQYPSCCRYISREFPDKVRMMKDREVNSFRCCQCNQLARRRIRWYAVNGHTYYSLASCQKHGFIIGRIRVKRTARGVYADKLMKPANAEEAEYVRIRREELRQKRREKQKEKQKERRKGTAGKEA